LDVATVVAAPVAAAAPCVGWSNNGHKILRFSASVRLSALILDSDIFSFPVIPLSGELTNPRCGSKNLIIRSKISPLEMD
jgi:hypothetical protein